MSHSGFETVQHVGNLKHKLEAQVIGLNKTQTLRQSLPYFHKG